MGLSIYFQNSENNEIATIYIYCIYMGLKENYILLIFLRRCTELKEFKADLNIIGLNKY